MGLVLYVPRNVWPCCGEFYILCGFSRLIGRLEFEVLQARYFLSIIQDFAYKVRIGALLSRYVIFPLRFDICIFLHEQRENS